MKTDTGISRPKYAVLKTWKGSKDELYENEVQVYRILTQHTDISRNILRFYGSWKQRDTYDILLEFVEGDTLTVFIDRDHSTCERDMLEFWRSLVQILLPTCRLHCLKDPDNSNEVISGQVIPSLYSLSWCTDMFKCPPRYQA
jgi:hypothetical protein